MTGRGRARGIEAEYKAIKELEKQGYTCIRSAGSRGEWDIIAYRDGFPNPEGFYEFRFVQVKRSKTFKQGGITVEKNKFVKAVVSFERWRYADKRGFR